MKPDRTKTLRFEDRTSFLYLEKCRVEREEDALMAINLEGRIQIPAARIAVLLLGPGTSLTQQAASVLSQCACHLAWVGEEGVRLYGFGQPLSGDTKMAEVQAIITGQEALRFAAAKRLFNLRFAIPAKAETMEQLRGAEGAITAAAYSDLAQKAGIEWNGRQTSGDWKSLDSANRALSAAHACLYPLAAAAILSQGLNPALGLIHRSDPWSLAYDLGDTVKLETAAPIAFAEAAKKEGHLESRVREAMRDAFRKEKTAERFVRELRAIYGERR